jgi:hypothetical protein
MQFLIFYFYFDITVFIVRSHTTEFALPVTEVTLRWPDDDRKDEKCLHYIKET